jgi:hypothetical protein
MMSYICVALLPRALLPRALLCCTAVHATLPVLGGDDLPLGLRAASSAIQAACACCLSALDAVCPYRPVGLVVHSHLDLSEDELQV